MKLAAEIFAYGGLLGGWVYLCDVFFKNGRALVQRLRAARGSR